MHTRERNARLARKLVKITILGDTLACFGGLSLGYWLRFKSPLRALGIEPNLASSYGDYFNLIQLGTLLFIASYSFQRLYEPRCLLRPEQSLWIIIRGTFFWVLLFLGFSLALKFEPSVSRIFVVISSVTSVALLSAWRFLFYLWVAQPKVHDRLVDRVVLVGWNREARALALAVRRRENRPYDIIGLVATEKSETDPGPPVLGFVRDIDTVLRRHQPSMVIVTDPDLSREELQRISSACERLYVYFKIVPSAFQVFVSNLQMETVSGVPVLGWGRLPLRDLHNAALKRAMDIFGALVGLIGAMPIMIVLALLIKRESPGPVLYYQTRTGLHGRPFRIYKLRSMRKDAEAKTGARWAVPNDNRRLKIGAFMREWNLDELPQFWNILRGDMSLVGPRPERPELIREFEKRIPHYNPRHEVRPGLTGWAQVNGLRGDTSLTERIRYDLYYIEKWSLWFDIQIMALTFLRRQNAY
ncbi:sugar transferase [Opitutus terrae]|uniref:Exopolysaccharide biosynthesis polyprenyl glycosylphosphotransferase n=1 Tax=Opitutus terrae (strain DSM 11246 / JCM 15787 / PB90-1) TaxID=452637 RepID=B1ZV53_OPITP|nr:sugar transferase [Opitutus terrae]ACB76720.1 exopolysaccharide biosynthesis polyprenyl glycosylphosphotransferase [Opitutus terrae PB90-1]